MTIAKYRMIDLIVLTILCVVVDTIGYFISQSDLLFFYVTLSTPILLIIYIRWHMYGLISTGVIAVLHLILYRNFELLSLVLYTLSIFGISIAMVWFKVINRNHIKDETLLLTLYFMTGYLAMFFIQVLTQYILFNQVEWIVLITRHAINFVLGWVILMIAKRQEDFMVDMKKYLLKQIKERKQEGSL